MSPNIYFPLTIFWFLIGSIVISRGLSDPIVPRRQDEFMAYFASIFILLPIWPFYVIVRFFIK